jgi:ferritin-like protein
MMSILSGCWFCVNLTDLDGEGVKQIAEDTRVEDRNHFEALVPRIFANFGGKLPDSVVEFRNISACRSASGSIQCEDHVADPRRAAERCAVCDSTQVCNMTFAKDHRTHDLALAILHEAIDQEVWFSAFLGRSPSSHYSREGGQTRPTLASSSPLSRERDTAGLQARNVVRVP